MADVNDNRFELHEIQTAGRFRDVVANLNSNFSLIIEAILKKRDGKSAFELWVEQPGNEGKTLNEFFASLKESGFAAKAVQSLPTGSNIEENTIYAVPEKSDDSLQSPDRWAEYIRKDNSWILLAQHTGAGLGELITNFANLRKEVADMIDNAMYADIKNYTSGKIINGDGTISDNDAYCLSEYIPVEYGQKIRFWLGNMTARLNVYNSNKQGLMSDCYKNSSSANPPESASNPRTVTLNANTFTTAAYFRMSFPKSKASEAYAQVLNALDEVISEWRPEEKVLKSSTQELTKEQIATVLDNLNMRTGVENGNVITFSGKGDTTAWSVTDRVTLIPKHTYRLWLQDTDWSLDGITVTSSGYDKLNFFIYNNPDGLYNDDGLYRINVLNPAVKMPEIVKPYYDYTVPEGVEIEDETIFVKQWWLRVYGRAAVGTEVKVRVEDITSLLQATSEADEDSDKTIAERLAEGNAVRLTYNDMIENFGENIISSLNGEWLNVNGCNGKQLSGLTTHRASATAKYKTYKIPLDGVAVVDVMQYQNEYARGSVLFDSEDNAVYGIVNKSACLNAWKRVYVTGDIAYLLYTVSSDFVGTDVLVLYPEGYTIGTSERDKGLGVVTEFNGTLKDNGEVLENGIIAGDGQKPAVGDNMLTWAGTSSAYNTRYIYTIVDISGYDKIDDILAFRGNSDPYGLFLDADMVVIQRLNNPTADNVNHKYNIEIPSGAKYFVNARFYTHSLYIKVSSAGIKGQVESNTLRIEALEQGGGGGDSTQSRTISLLQGNIGQNGSPVISSSHVYTTPIQGGRGFVLELNEGYELDCAHLYDDKNNLLAYNYIPASSVRALPMTAFYYRRTEDADGGVSANYYQDGRRRWYSNMTIPSGYSIVFIIRKYSAARGIQGATAVDLTPDENIIKEFTYLDNKELTSIVPDNMSLSILNNGKKRIYQLASVGWKALKTMPCSSSALTTAGIFDAGKYRFGVVYSEAAQFSKYVGQHVSLYTYLTALRNSRSVMYTEHIAANNLKKTEYGFDYNNLGGYSSNFYGTVCTGLTGFAMGLANVWISRAYKGYPSLLGLSVVQSYDVNSIENAIPPHTVVQPLDIIWYQGHCSIVEDVILDRNGNVKYVVWAEEINPTPSVAAMSPEMFDFRVQDHKDKSPSGCIIFRKNDWSQLAEPRETPFIEFDWLDTKIDKLYNIKYNPDICTMYGDKPCLAVGDILWLNFNKTKGYANIIIEKQGNNGTYSVENTITLEGNANVRTVTGEDTYSDINLAHLNLTQGKYRAKMTSSTIESGYTYWEMIGITLSVSKSGDNINVSFSAVGGTPYLLRQENMSGYMAINDNRVREIDAEDVSAGSITGLAWNATKDINQNTINSVIKVFVRGEYGVAVKAVEHPDNE